MTEQFAIVSLFGAMRRGSPLLWRSSGLMVIGIALCTTMLMVDDHMFAGINAWEKPAKFFLSLGVQALTIAWAISLLPKPARGIKTASWIYVAAAWFEIIYITFSAARGEASHFNSSSLTAIILYGLMGFGALMLTSTSAFIGWRVFQQRGGNLMREAAGMGLMLGAVLGTIAGAYLSSRGSHWIGGDQTDATGLPFFHWSTTGGDLRVAHFIGLHAAQFVPLAALSGSRHAVYGAATLTIVLMAATFTMAVMGVPVLRM
jgi:hypothetical protein